jgi:hypothetical protein
MRIQKPSEHLEQVKLFNWRNLNLDKYPQLKNMFAIPNGGHRFIGVAKKLKSEGVQAGVLDVFLAHPVKNIQIIFKGYSGLFIEMKFGKNNELARKRNTVYALWL